MEYLDIKNNETPEICSKCKGYCCKSYAGIYHPNDFKDIEKELKELKEKGLISVDQWNGELIVKNDDTEYYDVKFIRPRHSNISKFIDFSYGGRCIYLTEKGCGLPFEKRPYQCKMLAPINGEFIYGCTSPFNKVEAAISWIPFQNLIQKLIEDDENHV